MRAIFILLLLLAFTTPARAEPPLTLYAGIYTGVETHSGDRVEVVLSLYGTNPAPMAYTLDAPTPAGLQLISTVANTDTIAFDRPVTILLRYRITAPDDGRLIALRYRVCAETCARAETSVRVGSVAWPDAKSGSRVWLPLVRK